MSQISQTQDFYNLSRDYLSIMMGLGKTGDYYPSLMDH